MEKCAILQLFEILGEKWVLSILYTIKQNPGISFNELKNEVGITPKTLSTKLKHLEEKTLVEMKSDGFKHNFYLTKNAKVMGDKLRLLNPIAEKIVSGEK